MINYIIAFVLATIVYLIAIRYLQKFCPMSKFFKFVIYICISTVSVPAVNHIYPTENDGNNILSPIMNEISQGENSMNSDWQDAQKHANALVNGGSVQSKQQTNYQSNYSNNNQITSQQSDEQSQSIIIGRNGEVLN